jgi:Fe-Mn family superoxide dismutase
MDTPLNRRLFVEATAGAAALASLAMTTPARAADPTAPAPTAGAYDVKPLPFDPKKLNGISEKLIVSHHDNNYAGAVKRLNTITAQLASLDFATAPGFQINGLKREELIATNSMILHEHYFNALGGAGGDPNGGLAQALAHDFGSLARWRAEFSAMGKAEGGGSGWVILAYSPRDKRLLNSWAADHTTTLAGGQPVLVLDMYEHAYQMDYGAKAGAYVDAYMQGINWEHPTKLYEQYRREAVG